MHIKDVFPAPHPAKILTADLGVELIIIFAIFYGGQEEAGTSHILFFETRNTIS